MNDLGRRVYGMAAILLGLIGLRWGDFASVWQPVPKETPGYTVLAYLAAAIFLAGGALVQWRRSARWAGLAIAALFLVFDLLWLRRAIGFPGIFGTWLGVAEQSGMVVGGLLLWSEGLDGKGGALVLRGLEVAFGLCALAYGAAHFFYVQQTATLVPKWLPPGQAAWAYLTGACDIAGGLALLVDRPPRLPRIAAALLAAMYGVFALLVWLPTLLAKPAVHQAWAGNAINLTLVAAAWVLADRLGRRATVAET